MPENKICIAPPLRSDMAEIECLAREMELDREDFSGGRFLAAKREEKIIGFGRIREYPQCVEIATVGVVKEERNKGVGSMIVSELIKSGPAEIYVTCVIPHFFERLGFQSVKQYPAVLQKKVDFCKSYDFKDDEVFVMKINK